MTFLGRQPSLEVRRLESLDVHEEVGRGAFATVSRAVHRATGKEVAVKEIVTDNSRERRQVDAEILLNKRLTKHGVAGESFAKLRGAFEATAAAAAAAGGPSDVVAARDGCPPAPAAGRKLTVLVFDMLKGGSLADTVCGDDTPPLPENDAKQVTYRVLQGVASMHKAKMVHCDLKPANLVLAERDDFSSVRIVDLGLASDLSKTAWSSSYAGTPQYWAPEMAQCYLSTKIFNRPVPFGPQVDVWSVGVIAFQLLAGRLPFPSIDAERLLKSIQLDDVHFDSKCWRQFSPEAEQLIGKLLVKDSSARMSAEQALRHPWFDAVRDHHHSPKSPQQNPIMTSVTEMISRRGRRSGDGQQQKGWGQLFGSQHRPRHSRTAGSAATQSVPPVDRTMHS